MNAIQLLGDGTVGIDDAIKFTGMKRTLLYDLMTKGELQYVKVGARRLIPRKALVGLLASRLNSVSESEKRNSSTTGV